MIYFTAVHKSAGFDVISLFSKVLHVQIDTDLILIILGIPKNVKKLKRAQQQSPALWPYRCQEADPIILGGKKEKERKMFQH